MRRIHEQLEDGSFKLLSPEDPAAIEFSKQIEEFQNRERKKSLEEIAEETAEEINGIFPPRLSVKFPDVKVQLSGEDGNAFVIIGRVRAALRRSGHHEAVAEFTREAQSGDYDHVLQTCMDYVVVS